MVPAGGRPPRRGSVEQPLEQSAPRNLVAEQCEQTAPAKQNVRIERCVASPTGIPRNHSQEWTITLSRYFPNTAGGARRLCEGGAEAARRICPSGVDGPFSSFNDV